MKLKNPIALVLLFTAFSMILTSCENSQNKNAEEKTTSAKATDKDKAEIEEERRRSARQDEVDYAQVNSLVLKGYFQIKDALVESDANKAAEKATFLLDDFPEASTDELKSIEKNLRVISSSDDLVRQRTRFSELSESVYELAKKNPEKTNTVYRQYCPMAFDNEGAYWLSPEKKIRNPYFGDKMLKCGKVEEEI